MSNEELSDRLLQLFGLEDTIVFSKLMIDVSKMKCEEWDSEEPCEFEYDMSWWKKKYIELLMDKVENYEHSGCNKINSL